MKVCILASGSSGNATYVASGATAMLVDAGLSARQIAQRLGAIGVDIGTIRGVCVSHEHDDHIRGIRVLHNRHGMALYANAGTLEGVNRDPRMQGLQWNIFENGMPFAIGDLRSEPFSVPHDAYDPVGFVISGDGVRVGIVTDMGMSTRLVQERLRGCRVIVMESNHDPEMLRQAQRPEHLKQRILGRQGHMSNEAAAQTVAEIAGPELQQLFLAHLSAECNCPQVALNTARRLLRAAGHEHVRISLTYADQISEVWAV